MIYTTGGMRVARVSVVDSRGKDIFDELVRMDDGVEVMSVADVSYADIYSNRDLAVISIPVSLVSHQKTTRRHYFHYLQSAGRWTL